MVKAIFFDLDGTLVDTLPLYVKSYSYALKNQGFSFPDREIVARCFGKPSQEICNELNIPGKTNVFERDYHQEVRRTHFSLSKLFDNATKFLADASEKNIKLGIISYAFTWYVNSIVDQHKLRNYFETIIGFDDVTKAKPDPEGALLACKRFGVNPNEAIMIGDSKSDILMGKSAGCKTVLFYPKGHEIYYDIEELKKLNPDKIVTNYNELQELVN